MKRIFTLFLIVMFGYHAVSQSVVVSFTGENVNKEYVQIDSVVIMNLSENWSIKLNYPDTMFDLMTVGIAELENIPTNFQLSQNIPNPFNGSTNFTLQTSEREYVSIEIRDMLGRLIVDYNNVLSAGVHSFDLQLNIPQMYFVTAKTNNQISTIKMVNTQQTGFTPSIHYRSQESYVETKQATQKSSSGKIFSVKDTMLYVVYYQGIYTTVAQRQMGSEDFVYTFDTDLYVDQSPQNRTILLEEFTGTNCGYCPDGHRRADSLVNVHPGVIYNVNIHAGSFAAKYKTNIGTLLNSKFYVTGYPTGMVSREVVNDGGNYKYAISRGGWGYVAQQLFVKPSYVNVAAKTTIDTVTRKLTCNVQAYFTANSTALTGNNYVHIVVLQDSIWGPQSNGKNYYPAMWDDSRPNNMKYCHNHMLREMPLGIDGENIGGNFKGNTYQKTFTYDIPLVISEEDVILPHLSVLVFITEGRPTVLDEYKNNKERVIYVTQSELILTEE